MELWKEHPAQSTLDSAFVGIEELQDNFLDAVQGTEWGSALLCPAPLEVCLGLESKTFFIQQLTVTALPI